ncbi:hypothetical protein PHYSODRAFT_253703 [Phytophthora sojae]|uniref:Uncharacterized protein n=1 Tax=Phytophthora sojae (strain P6497) TaxID=1094619 RepID=G4YSI1_PHYSP|nr:hypothetical protein PHYSODRAFT_253703 [Phytophthora sojae]EGZ22997.1 hypothetical protein PHYSODRAFT_253703 [Phytophthora sojae]|eukprot:XP_009518285.1 hypothetical protein PHYSODRAFT_253703 [Phytophthora sojae]
MSNGRDSLEAEAKDATPGAVPSVIGTSRASNESTASGVQTSYGSSSSSSMMSLGQRVGALALVAQRAGGFAAAGDLGFQATRTVIPSRIVSVDQDDVEMASSVHSDPEIAPRKAGLPRISATTSEPKLRVSALIAGFGGPRDVSADERSQHQSSKSEKIICVEPLEWIQESWQEWQARMEQEQREFLARERLDALERERLKEQRDLDARRQIQELTDHLVHAEIARGEAERRAKDVESRQTQSSTETQGMTQSITEAVRLERERLDAAYAERWQQHEAEADSERARWVSETYAGWKEQMSTMEQKVQELEAERERERVSSENIQRFHAGQTSADTSGRIARVKRGHGTTETKVTQDVKLEPVSLGKMSDPRRTATFKASQDSKTDSKRSAPKKHQQKKKKRQDVNPPSDSDPSSDSSDDDSSSESSDDSSDGNPGVNLTTASTAQAGTTLLTFRPYINSNTLGAYTLGRSTAKRARRTLNAIHDGDEELRERPGFLLSSEFRKADIDFRKSSKRLEKHIRRFITKLRDTRLKTSLQGQRFRSIADLEYALEQDEEV